MSDPKDKVGHVPKESTTVNLGFGKMSAMGCSVAVKYTTAKKKKIEV